jgi:uncharacterized protein (TIGR02757 family)
MFQRTDLTSRKAPNGAGLRDTVFLREVLEELYARLNRREYVHPDPLEFLYAYEDVRDREIAGLVASGLAYGRVAQVLKSVRWVLDRMPQPARFLAGATRKSLISAIGGFKHRFTTGIDLADMLWNARQAIEKHGSLEACFTSGLQGEDETVVGALGGFACALSGGEGCASYLAPSPEGGSACKRLNLYLRWMARRDDVDPGGWTSVPASKLVVPLDTHMFRIGRELGLTERKQADLKTALEITGAFREISPEDPVKYDFALTRLGIRSDMDTDELFERCIGRRG